jgi:hypothetical protein
MVCQTLVTLKMDTLLFLWTLLTVPPYHLLVDLTSRQGTWIYVCNTCLPSFICAQLPCLGSNQVCESMFSYKSSCFLLHMWAVQMPSTTTSPQATGCLRALQVVKDHTAHVWDFTQAVAFKTISIFPRDFIPLQMSTAASEQCGNNVLYLCKYICIYNLIS